MPSTAIIGPTVPVWHSELWWPVPGVALDVGGNASLQSTLMYRTGQFPAGTGTPLQTFSVSNGSVPTLQWYQGRMCAQKVGTVNGAQLVGFPWWAPLWGPAAGVNPGGAWVPPPSAVAVFDFQIALAAAAFAYTADSTGWVFIPNNTTGLAPNPVDAVPGGAVPTGGFGVLVNDDGGGQSQYELVSWDAAGVVQSRTAAPAGSVADVTDWSNVRMLIRSGDSSHPARLYAWINGTSWLSGQEFDDVSFFRPNTLVAAHATQYGLAHVLRSAGAGPNLYTTLSARFGPTLPDGSPGETE